jgi:AcrR family transcriptional regulator
VTSLENPDASQPKRSRGRPGGGGQATGRESLIAAARKLLRTHPPAEVTSARIAREAGADPALVRYHFGNRETLLLAVVEEIIAAHRAAHPPLDAPPAEQLAGRVRDTVRLARGAQSMQRLLIDELALAKSPAIRARISAMNATAVGLYARVLDQNRPGALEPADPLFVFIAVVGMCDFFASAKAMITPLVPVDTDFDELANRYVDFAIKLVLDGLRPR